MTSLLSGNTVTSSSSSTLPKVVVVAYACEPLGTSEPGVGWNFIREISTFANVWAITRSNNRDVIEAGLAAAPSHMRGRVHWIYVDLPPILTRLKKKVGFGAQLYYMLWQWKALRSCLRLNRSIKFDLSHHLTFGITWISPALFFAGVPLIWGPIGGTYKMPRAIFSAEPIRNQIRELVYQFVPSLLLVVSKVAKFGRRHASAILFRTRTAEQQYPATPDSLRYVVSESALNVDRPDFGRELEKNYETIFAVCVGRMIYWKGFHYAIKGFKKFIENGGEGHMVLLGDGPELPWLRKYIEENDLGGIIQAPGKVPHERVEDILEQANVLIHPSFRDGTSWAVLEAMRFGLPVICLDRGGTAEVVDEECGRVLQCECPEQVISDIAQTLEVWEKNRDLAKKLSKGAQLRIYDSYNWDSRGKQIKKIYEDVLNAN